MRPFVTKFLSDSRYSCYLVDVVVCGRIWLHLLCTDDQCRGSGPVCQGGSDLHHRAHPQSVDPHGGQQATHATGQTHSMICANSVSLGNFVTPLRTLPWSDHISSYPLSVPSVGLHLLLLPSLYFYHLFLFDSSPIPLQHWAVCCVCVHTQAEAPIPASPWGPSLCLVLSPSIDFESKARRVALTPSPPPPYRCHFACSAVPKLNKMDSGMMWGGERKTENVNVLMGTFGKIRQELVSPGRQERENCGAEHESP